MRNMLMKKKKMLYVIVVCAVLLGLCWFVFRGLTAKEIINGKRCFIRGEQEAQMTLQIPVSVLPDSIYEKGGHEFAENEVVVYQTDNTTIYLERVMPANEGDDQLYFTFRFFYELTDEGQILTSYHRTQNQMYTTHVGPRTDVLTDDKTSYADAVHMRGSGTDNYFILYVDTEVCKAAVGTIRLDVYCWEIHYERKWPWS